MKPYGRDCNLKDSGGWKKDYHLRPKKKWYNWWEDIMTPLTRTAMKRNWKKEIDEEMQ